MKRIFIIGIAVFLVSTVHAQAGSDPAGIREPEPKWLTAPNQAQEEAFEGNRSQIDDSGPGSTGTLACSGVGAHNWSNDSADTSNASNPERGVPNSGGSGGDNG